MSSYKSTTLVGENTDLHILLLYYANDDCKDLYFRSDKDQMKPRVYNIKVLKQLFGNDVCTDLLFAHAFTGYDTTSRVFGIGKKTVFNKIVKRSPKLQSCSPVVRHFVHLTNMTQAVKRWRLCSVVQAQIWNLFVAVFFQAKWLRLKALLNQKGFHQQQVLQNSTH